MIYGMGQGWVSEGDMPKEVHNALTPARVRQEKKPGRYADGNGLYLVVSDTGGRWWEWRGVVRGRGRVIRGVGPARVIPLADARETARSWRAMAREGVDPKVERDKARRESLSFEQAARKVHAEQVEPHNRNAKHRAQWINTLSTYAFPIIGSLPVEAVTQSDVLKVLAPIWTEKPETARRVRQRIRTVMDWARTAGHCEGVNPVEGVEKGLPRHRDKTAHHAALPYGELPGLMQRLSTADGIASLALRFAILTGARSGEVRGATWAEIDLKERLWIVPADRMKAGVEHRVPLSDAALAVAEAVKGLDLELLFPSPKRGVLSDMALAAVLKRLEVPATVHGMRSTFRDWCEEKTGFPHAVKEAALAHTVRNKVEAAYRRSDLLAKRRQLMDQWARFCLSGEKAGQVVELRA